MNSPSKLLFICSRNQWRSPTAEQLWKDKAGFQARSAGTSPRAKRTVSPADIRWADIIFVMEKKHKNRLAAKFTRMLEYKPIHILDIPDDYKYMDQALISELRDKVDPVLDRQQ
jgi:predicted protein tyrosine phosphatase